MMGIDIPFGVRNRLNGSNLEVAAIIWRFQSLYRYDK